MLLARESAVQESPYAASRAPNGSGWLYLGAALYLGTVLVGGLWLGGVVPLWAFVAFAVSQQVLTGWVIWRVWRTRSARAASGGGAGLTPPR